MMNRMEKRSRDHSLITEQIGSLRSTHFWRMNQLKARSEGDQDEVKKSGEAIRLAMDQSDDLQVSFKLQNQTLMAAEQGLSFSWIEKGLEKELKM